MKKLLTLICAGVCATGAQAQQAKPAYGSLQIQSTPSPISNADVLQFLQDRRNEQETAAKGTAFTGTRWYNYVDILSGIDPNIDNTSNFPYVWSTFNALASYSSGYDTINFASWGMILDPYADAFNEPANANVGLGTYGLINTTKSYKVDSVIMYGSYGRVASKPNVVDTMKIALFYAAGGNGTNLTIQRDAIAPGDTCFFAVPGYDSVNVRAVKPFIVTGTPPAINYYNIPLTAASLNDTTASGLDRVRFAPNMSVPAGNLVGMTATFKSGDPAFTPYDTAIKNNGGNTIAYKYNVWRPMFFDSNPNGDPVCYDDDFNAGLVKLLPLSGDPQTSYRQLYFPTRFLTPSSAEFPYIDFKLSSTQFEKLSVGSANTIQTNEGAYPNPAHTVLNIPVQLTANGDVTIEVYNNMGQVIRTKALGTVKANSRTIATVSTSDLAPGVYFYTIKTGAERVSKSFTVTH